MKVPEALRFKDIHDEAFRKLGNEKYVSHLEVPDLYYDKDCRLAHSYPREAAEEFHKTGPWFSTTYPRSRAITNGMISNTRASGIDL
jgi:hypothetical protein